MRRKNQKAKGLTSFCRLDQTKDHQDIQTTSVNWPGTKIPDKYFNREKAKSY